MSINPDKTQKFKFGDKVTVVYPHPNLNRNSMAENWYVENGSVSPEKRRGIYLLGNKKGGHKVLIFFQDKRGRISRIKGRYFLLSELKRGWKL